MIEYRRGNIIDVTKGVIIHGCNAKGFMGSGVALAIKTKYPECYKTYEYYYNTTPMELGEIVWYTHDDKLWIANAITQETYGRSKNKRYVNYAAIASVFKQAVDFCSYNGDNLHFPMIGAGLGNGDWEIIAQLINDCDPKDEVNKICWSL